MTTFAETFLAETVRIATDLPCCDIKATAVGLAAVRAGGAGSSSSG